MNTRERFIAVTNCQPTDRTLKWEMGYWGGAIRRWYKEGLPKIKGIPEAVADGSAVMGEDITIDPQTMNPIDAAKRDTDVSDYFGSDEPIWRVPLNNYVYPLYEEEILEDHGSWVLMRDQFGVISKNTKDRNGFPHWIETPVKTRDDWEKLKVERLKPTLNGRLPENWSQWKEVFKDRTFPLIFGGYPTGFYGTARFLLGEENVMLAFYDTPELVRDIMEYMANFWVGLYDQVLNEIDVDGILIWEDMCYKNGPLISPAMFREFILPGYKKVTDCLKSHGVKSIVVDTDGACGELIPLFIEGGVTAMGPFEQAAGMDIVKVRKEFPDMAILGGIDKAKLKDGKEAIDKELEKVPWLLEQGGFVPHVDHQVPMDVPWENFKYYRQKLNKMIG